MIGVSRGGDSSCLHPTPFTGYSIRRDAGDSALEAQMVRLDRGGLFFVLLGYLIARSLLAMEGLRHCIPLFFSFRLLRNWPLYEFQRGPANWRFFHRGRGFRFSLLDGLPSF
jgi:hypothetical protein